MHGGVIIVCARLANYNRIGRKDQSDIFKLTAIIYSLCGLNSLNWGMEAGMLFCFWLIYKDWKFMRYL